MAAIVATKYKQGFQSQGARELNAAIASSIASALPNPKSGLEGMAASVAKLQAPENSLAANASTPHGGAHAMGSGRIPDLVDVAGRRRLRKANIETTVERPQFKP